MLSKYLLRYLLFAFTMFAAADVGIGGGDTGGGDGADAGGHGADADGEDAGLGGGGEDGLGPADEGASDVLGEETDQLDADQQQRDAQRQREPDDKETGDLKGLVSRRLVALKKEAPELAGVFQKYPKVQEQIEAAFRRDMGYRELGTIADFRAFREEFPGGMPDVQQLRTELAEVEQLDQNFYGRDAQGNYIGHANLIENLFSDDRTAAVALFRTVPKEWARLDPESYNEVMGQVVGATHSRAQLPEWLDEISEAAKDPKNLPLIQRELGKIKQWSQSFLKPKAAPTEEERRLEGQRQQFQRETNERNQQDFTRFKTTFFSESDKLQTQIIRKHPAIAQMLTTKALPEAKKSEIVREVQKRIREHLKKSTAFMSKLRPAYESSNLEKALELQKAQWSYPWILNKFVRAVLAEQAPTLVRQNRERARSASGSQRQPDNRGRQQQQQQQSRERQRTEPYKEAGVWYSKDGRRLTTSEILRGAVPDHLLNAK